jgi:NADPH-dependent 2,4-dienoyl-CoA reductase/sulfur reductase-like enzyme
MKRFELAIAGGGLTAARAIRSYREAGGDGDIALFSEEEVLPYHRPALSKQLLRGETDATPYVEPESFYDEFGVKVMLGRPVTSIHTTARVLTAGGAPFGFEQLLIATGAKPRRLDVPGIDLPGVFPLRTVQDSVAIRRAAAWARKATVVGGGFIGMEVAASLRRLGVAVTLVHLGEGLFEQLGSEQLSTELLALYEEQGVDVLLEEEVARFGGDDGLEYVETATGVCIQSDIAVLGIGVVPNTSFLAGSGLAVDDGILVDERFEASAAGFYAAGDVANFFDPLFARRRRIEHWSNAGYQGTEVGRVLAGGGAGYDTVSSFFTEVFGLTLKVFGDVSRFDELITDGSLASGSFLASYGDAGRMVGAIAYGHSEETERLVTELIEERAPARALHDDLVCGGGSR